MGVGRSGGDIGNDISSTAFFGEAKPQATLCDGPAPQPVQGNCGRAALSFKARRGSAATHGAAQGELIARMAACSNVLERTGAETLEGLPCPSLAARPQEQVGPSAD
jgi:hypothetical protein